MKRQDLDALIEELVSNPRYVHLALGALGKTSHCSVHQRGRKAEEPKGDFSYHPNFSFSPGIGGSYGHGEEGKCVNKMASEVWKPYETLMDMVNHQSEAHVFGEPIEKSYVFQMIWPDNTYDHR